MRYLALAALLVACAPEPGVTSCPTGIFCPSGTTCAAAQAVCITGKCGNGVVDPGEECDDGNIIDGDHCSSSCRAETCGNNVVDPGEQCDDGNLVDGDGCSSKCTIEKCGNGIKDKGEACDDGNNIDGDGCSANCLSTEICGNGIVDKAVGEVCDDGNTVDGDGCSSTCEIESAKKGGGCCETGTSPAGPLALGAVALGLVLRRRRR